MKLYNFVYKTTNLINNKYYIGVHSTDDLDDGYLGSGDLIKKAIRKYTKSKFIRHILFFCDSLADAYAKEKELVTEEVVMSNESYNLLTGGVGSKGHTKTSKKVISEKNKAFWETDIGLARLKEYTQMGKARWADATYRERMLEIFNSDVRKNKLSKGIKKWISDNPEAHMERMLKINKNPEKIRKMAEKHRGMKRSDEARKNISESLKGKTVGEKNAEFKGYYHTPAGIFASLEAAATASGCSKIGVRDRCVAKNSNNITKFSVITDKSGFIKEDCVGKTWNESGWSFEPKAGSNE